MCFCHLEYDNLFFFSGVFPYFLFCAALSRCALLSVSILASCSSVSLLTILFIHTPHGISCPVLLNSLVPVDTSESSSALYIVNVERNGKVIYTWKGNQRNTHIGLYDLQTKQNEHLYMFEKDLYIISCSINNERTLLAVSFRQYTEEERVSRLLQSVSKYLTLLIEIHPINNVRVLKAVDSCVRVQFLYPVEGRNASTESRLLLVSEDKYIEQFDIHVGVEEEHKVVIQNSGQLPRARVVDDLIWAQWDMMEQRLFYIVPKLESHLDISVNDTQLKLVNFGYDYCQDQDVASKSLNLQVFTSKAGSLCVCCSLASDTPDEIMYSIYFLHKGYNKTFTVSLERTESHQLKEVAFMNLDYYVAAYLPGQFLHLLNIQHPDLLCYSLFLTGEEARIDMLQNCSIRSPLMSTVLDCHIGSMYAVSIRDSTLLQFLQNSKRDSERLAALHCALLHFQHTEDLEMQIIWWISENLSTCHSFDPIQEFIIASLYCRMCSETHNLDKLLPYTSLLDWIGIIPGVTCATDIISLPVLEFQNSKGFWEKLNSNLESVKYAEPHLHYHSNVLRREWRNLSEEREERRTTAYLRNIFENAKKVLSHLDTWDSEERLVPLFQEEDYQQQLLMGLMVAQLKDHLMRHLQYVGKKKIDQIVLDYVANLLNLVHRIMKEVWRRYQLHSCIFCFDERGSTGEFAVFHIMSRILEAANGMCMPLPPGFHTLHLGLGVRCLPLHTLLHYIDNGVLHLTETCVRKLLKDLDDTEKNEKLKFSIVMRLPEALGQKVRQFWNHPINANFIARKYVKLLLEKLGNRQCSRPIPERLSVPVEFLPLNYLTNMLAEVESQGVHPYEKQDHVNVRFVEETALKHTMTLLGLKYS
ncbi:gamma-secretase-activating protein isoform X2 [Egretta garzetta]|uniref:gamma-secretase-activating protein isoform X2 n=1 Tax=Egretta garzetta TaxID=188379 RepID=UPI00163BFB61|nr:gamma-secretase-activating protein isoform X2 [Egretta garzetta]